MATPPYIEVTFDPPSASDTDSVFDTKASDTVGKLNPWGTEANDLADWIGTKADQALAAATGGDLPDLVGFGDQFIRVNSAETAVEFFDLGAAVDIAGLTFSAGDILYHDGTGLVNLGSGAEGQVLTQGASVPEWGAPPIGAGQTWQDVSGSRSGGTTYQNTTGRPIQVSLNYSNAGNERFQVSTDGTTWVDVAVFDDDAENFTGIVPNQHYYRTTGGSFTWVELR